MSILDVSKQYSNLAANNPGVLSDFSKSSAYGKPKTPFVINSKKCINFDKAKEVIDKSLKSVDSLYISIPNNAVYFIEFKNSTFSNVHNNLVEKAYDSTIVHHRVCKLSGYADHQNKMVCVLSFDKTKAKTATDKMLFAMLNNSGYKSHPDVLSAKFKEAYQNYLAENHLCPAFIYTDFQIIFDTFFNSFVCSI